MYSLMSSEDPNFWSYCRSSCIYSLIYRKSSFSSINIWICWIYTFHTKHSFIFCVSSCVQKLTCITHCVIIYIMDKSSVFCPRKSHKNPIKETLDNFWDFVGYFLDFLFCLCWRNVGLGQSWESWDWCWTDVERSGTKLGWDCGTS